jgi:hypothetical protein
VETFRFDDGSLALDLDAPTGQYRIATRASLAMSSNPDVFARLDRIKELWRELEGTRRTSPRYEDLVGEIRAESVAYQALLTEQEDLDRKQARLDVDSKDVDSTVDSKQSTVNRQPVERRPIDRRKTLDRRKQ